MVEILLIRRITLSNKSIKLHLYKNKYSKHDSEEKLNYGLPVNNSYITYL